MLRASVDEAGQDGLHLPPISEGIGDPGITHGRELIAFVDAVVLHDLDEFPTARTDLELCAGEDAADRAAMIIGNFSMMNRALDAIGAPVSTRLLPIAEELRVAVPTHLLD